MNEQNVRKASVAGTAEPRFRSRNSAVADVLALGDEYRNQNSELTPEDIQAILKAHNDLRARYGIAPLQWSKQLASHAKLWADTCYWGHWKAQQTKTALGDDYFPPPQQMGENLSVWRDPGSTMLAGQYGTKLWLDEEKDFDCQTGQCVPGRMCGHWTQMIWEDTKRVGCALRTCKDGIDPRSWPSSTKGVPGVQYLVCQYDPPGNYTGERPFPLSKCSQPGRAAAGAPTAVPVAPQAPIDVGRTHTPSTQPTAAQPPSPGPTLQPRQPIVPRTTPTAGMVAQNENMSSVPQFFQGMGRSDTPSRASSFQRPVFVPPGVTLVAQPANSSNAEAPPARPATSASAKTNAPIAVPPADAEKPGSKTAPNRPPLQPPLTAQAPRSDAQNVALVAGGTLAASAAIGAALGAGFFFFRSALDRSDDEL